MTNIENHETTENSRQKRRASWAAGIFTVLGLAFLGLSIYAVFVLQKGRFDLSDQILMPITGLMFLVSLGAYILIRRDRIDLGAWLIFGASLFPPLFAALVLDNFGSISIIFIIALTPILIFQVLPISARRLGGVVAGATGVVIILIEVWNPSFRLGATIVPNFVAVVVPLAVLGLLGFSIRRAWRGNLRSRLILSFLLVTIVPLVVVGAIISLQTFNTLLPQALELQNQTAKLVAEQTRVFIQARENELQALTDIRGLASLSLEEQSDVLAGLLSAQDVYDEIILVDGEGQEQIFLSRLEIKTAETLVSRIGQPEFDLLKELGETYFSPVQFDEVTGEPFMVISVPAIDLRSGDIAYALIAKFRFKTVWDLMAQADGVGSGIVYMVDNANQVVAHANPSIVLQGTQVELPLESTFTSGIAGTEVALAIERFSLGQQTFTVVAEQPRAEAIALATNNLTITVFVVVIAMVVAGLFGAFVAQIITTPIIELATVAESVSSGDFSRQVEIRSQDETATLATAFNSMTTQLRTLIGSLEQRVADRTRALATTSEVSRRLSTILDQGQLVREVVEQLTEAFGFYHAHIYLYDETKQNLEMVGGTGEAGQAMLARGHKIEPGRGLVGRAVASNEVVLIPDVAQADGWLPNPLLPETKAEVAVPIAIGTDVLGVLDVQHNVTDGLTETDADLIQSIANQVAIAVQNAQAYTRAQRQAVREAQIAAINQRIQSAGSIDDVLKIAVSELGRTLGSQTSVELKVKPQSNES